jgi:hypothetical protein
MSKMHYAKNNIISTERQQEQENFKTRPKTNNKKLYTYH